MPPSSGAKPFLFPLAILPVYDYIPGMNCEDETMKAAPSAPEGRLVVPFVFIVLSGKMWKFADICGRLRTLRRAESPESLGILPYMANQAEQVSFQAAIG